MPNHAQIHLYLNGAKRTFRVQQLPEPLAADAPDHADGKGDVPRGTTILRSRVYDARRVAAFVAAHGDPYLELESGELFGLDAHGLWLLKPESDAMWKLGSPDQVEWLGGVRPRLASK